MMYYKSGYVNTIVVKMSEASGVKMAHSKSRFPNIKEYIFFYKQDSFKTFYEIDKYKNKEWDKENNIFLENFTKEERRNLIKLEEKEFVSDENVLEAIKLLSKVKKRPLSEKIKEISKKGFDVNEWLLENSFRIIKTAGSSSLAKQVLTLKNISNQEISAFKSKENILFYYITDFNRITKTPRLQVLFADTALWKNPCDFWQDIKTTGAIAKEGGVELNGGKKPEKLIHRIMKMVTKENDIILDFFAGSGTSGAVAHKMKRQYILTEQMDYIHDLPEARLKNVINGDQTGISKEVNWKGGGSFTYLELKKHNENFIEQIEKAKDSKALLEIWEQMKVKSFLNYNVDIKKQDENIDGFKELELNQQKEHLIELLDKNQLYVNLSSINDNDFEVSKEEKQVTKDFYQIKG